MRGTADGVSVPMRLFARLATIALIAGLALGCGSASADRDDRSSTMTIAWAGNDPAEMRSSDPKRLLWLPAGHLVLNSRQVPLQSG